MSEPPSIPNSQTFSAPASPLIEDQVQYISSTSSHSRPSTPPPPPSPQQQHPERDPATPTASASPSPKRPRVAAPEAAQCTICFEPLANSGAHQICCMPCGHVFGFQCINQWLCTSSANRFCPTCKTPGKPRHLRYIFGLPERACLADRAAMDRLRDDLRQEKAAHVATRARMREYKTLVATLRKQNAHLSRRVPSVQTFAARPQQLLPPVSLLTTRVTNGGTTVLAFGDDSSFLFPERFSRSAIGHRHKIVRVPLGQPTLGSVSPCAMEKRVNEISVCTVVDSLFHRHIAIARADKRISLLRPDLQHATDLLTPAVPLSCAWHIARPHLLMVGLSNGFVSTFDVRSSAQGPLCNTQVVDVGQRALHSIGQVAVNGVDGAAADNVLVTASACGLNAVTFDGYMDSPVCSKVSLSQDDGSCETASPFICGVTVAGGFLAVTSREPGKREGRIIVHKGLVRNSEGNWALGAVLGSHLTGHMQDLPFCQTALLPGSSDGTGSVVVTGDAGVMCKSRMWEYTKVAKADREWRDNEQFLTAAGVQSVGDLATVRCARACKLPRTARLPSIPTGSRGVIGCVSDNCIRLYSIGSL